MIKSRKTTLAAVIASALLILALTPAAIAADTAPVCQNLELTTYRGVSVGGKLEAADPEGDALRFEITTPPTKGSVELQEDGSFVYTPDEGRRGRDYFGYRAIDAGGSRSQEATVIIRILKPKSAPSYRDMQGRGSEYAAAVLAERGIFRGEQLGGAWFFRPEQPVTRGDFLAMCMELSDVKLLSGAASTGFLDDGEIENWQKPYVATALMEGMVSGYSIKGGALFAPNEAISRSEAAVMLDRVLGTLKVSAEPEQAAPVWAASAIGRLAACGAMPAGKAYDAPLTREDAALMLVRAAEA